MNIEKSSFIVDAGQIHKIGKARKAW